MRKIRLLAGAAALCMALGAVLPAQVTAPVTAHAEVTQEGSTFTFDKAGEYVQFEIDLEFLYKPYWSSGDTNVATVTADGKKVTITAVGKGKTYIMATTDTGIALTQYDVVVKDDASAPVVDGEKSVLIGEFTLDSITNSAALAITGVDSKDVEWSSTDEAVATVDSEGNVRAVGKGKCTINGVYNGVTYYALVTSEYEPMHVTIPESKIGAIELSDKVPASKVKVNAPEGAEIDWSTTDDKVATVSDSGDITATGSGECRIYAQINGVRYYVEVTSTYTGKMLIGDANLDGKVTVADAVAILQSIANRDKYGLSPVGALNADVDGISGVTAKDALVILQFDAEVVTELPLAAEK